MGDRVLNGVLLLHVTMDALIVGTLITLSQRILAGSRSLGQTAAMVVLICQPFTAGMIGSLYTEQTCSFFFFWGTLCLLMAIFDHSRAIFFFSGGFLLGLAGLLRSDVLLLCAVMIAAAVFWMVAIDTHRKRALGSALVISVGFVLPPTAMVLGQYGSTGEIGFVKPVFHNAGYMAWMRTWFAVAHYEHDRFAFSPGETGWSGFKIENYPARAFDSDEERRTIASLCESWKAEGYTAAVDGGFRRAAVAKMAAHPLRHYAGLPLLRMVHFWLNLDGGQVWIASLNCKRPLSTGVVAFVLAIRGLVVGLAIIGGWTVVSRVMCRTNPWDWPLCLAAVSMGLVLLRTLELGAMGSLVWAGLMEVRYVQIVFPFQMILSMYGFAAMSRAAGS